MSSFTLLNILCKYGDWWCEQYSKLNIKCVTLHFVGNSIFILATCLHAKCRRWFLGSELQKHRIAHRIFCIYVFYIFCIVASVAIATYMFFSIVLLIKCVLSIVARLVRHTNIKSFFFFLLLVVSFQPCVVYREYPHFSRAPPPRLVPREDLHLKCQMSTIKRTLANWHHSLTDVQ